MPHERERELLVAFARRLGPDGLAIGTSGNLSVREGEVVLVTPSGVDYEDLRPERICAVALDGTPEETDAEPSSELPMHLAAYRATAATAVVHTHSPDATALSTVVEELPAIHYLVALLGGPVPVVPYAPPGSEELAASVEKTLIDRSAVLLGNHGALTVGRSLEAAYERSVLLEWLCTVYGRARLLGTPRILSDTELDEVAVKLEGYGPWGGA